jgi:hypothetical protein
MTKTFTWREQLAVGDRGEELFMQHYPEPLTVFPEHRADFRRVSDGLLIELKTDTYSLEKTENCFMERWGDATREKVGGPWRSRRDRVPVFVYYFVRHNVWLEWNTKELCKLLERLTKKQSLIYIKNQGWLVQGYKVPIQSVLHLATVHTFKHAGIDGAKEWKAFLKRTEK